MPSSAPSITKDEGRSRVEHEDTLINHRVSWLIGSQSFLFAAYVLLINNKEFYNPNAEQEYICIANALVYFISFIGLIVSLCSSLAVVAAFFAIRAWKSYVSPVEDQSTIRSKTKIAHFGGLAAIIPGPVIFSIWSLLLYFQWNRVSSLPKLVILVPVAASLLVTLIWTLFNWSLFQITPRDGH